MGIFRIQHSFICLHKRWGFTINNLHSGRGFALYLGKLFIWQQAWFGRLNEVHWACGKFRVVFPFLNKEYSPKQGWKKIR